MDVLTHIKPVCRVLLLCVANYPGGEADEYAFFIAGRLYDHETDKQTDSQRERQRERERERERESIGIQKYDLKSVW